jgi:hypothetical protein
MRPAIKAYSKTSPPCSSITRRARRLRMAFSLSFLNPPSDRRHMSRSSIRLGHWISDSIASRSSNFCRLIICRM